MGFIYKIFNNLDEKIYIGSTINLNKRWLEHKRDLLNKTHPNTHLQRFVNKNGIDSILFDIIEEVDNGEILNREQFYLDTIKDKFNNATSSSAPMTNKPL